MAFHDLEVNTGYRSIAMLNELDIQRTKYDPLLSGISWCRSSIGLSSNWGMGVITRWNKSWAGTSLGNAGNGQGNGRRQQ